MRLVHSVGFEGINIIASTEIRNIIAQLIPNTFSRPDSISCILKIY